MALVVLVSSIAVLAAGIFLIVFACRRYGYARARQNIFSRAGALLTGGVLLVTAGFAAGLFSVFLMLAASHLRQTWNEELVKMFGRPPDRLELEEPERGSLPGSRGIAEYEGRRYRIECSGGVIVRKDGKDWWEYTLTATPLDGGPPITQRPPRGSPPPR